jgi:hypothetical protein
MKYGAFLNSFFLFLSLKSYAFDPGIIRQLNDMNKGNPQPKKVNCLNSFATPMLGINSPASAEYNDCAVGLCGLPQNNPSAWVTNTNFSESIQPKLLSEIEKLNPLFDKVYSKIKINNLKSIQELKSFLNPETLNKFDISTLPQEFQEDLSKLIFLPYIKETIDHSRPTSQRIKLSLNPPPNCSKEFKQALSDFSEQYLKNQLNDYLSFTEKNIYKKEELIPLAKEHFLKMKALIKSNIDSLTEYQKKDSSLKLEEIQKYFDEKPSDKFDSSLIFFKLSNVESFLFLLKDKSLRIAPPATCTTSACSYAFIEFLKNQHLDEAIRTLEVSLKDNSIKEKSINRCKAYLISKTITEADLNKSQKIFEEAKNSYIKNILPRFSEHSRKILLNYLQNSLKMTNKQIEKDYKKGSGKEILDQFKTTADLFLQAEYITFDMDISSAIKHGLEVKKNINDIDPFSDTDLTCSQELGANTWDMFIPNKQIHQVESQINNPKSLSGNDHISISDFSCNHELRGKLDVAHEIGHAINWVFSSQKLSEESAATYKKIRSCVTDNYINPTNAKTFFSQPGDSIYTEEDTADLFAIMSSPETKELFTCSLLKPSYHNEKYLDLDFIREEGDTHSTSFSRVLFEATNRGIPLPVSCQRIINSDQPKLRFKKCL